MQGSASAAEGGPAAAPVAPHEKIALGVAGLACGLYLLHSLPAILFPTCLLASAVTLLAGILLGLAGAGGALAVAFYHLTHPKPGSQGAPHAGEQLRPTSSRARHSRHLSGTSATTASSDVPPHAIALRGELSGVVYTAPASAWQRADCVFAWPPTCDPLQPFRAWEASVSQGTLVLRPLLPAPGAKPPSPGRGGGGGASTSASPDPAPHLGAPDAGDATAAAAAAAAAPSTKVGIPLEGCIVEVVTDGLNGRSEWIRRAPLRISHPKWPLLEGEQAFYLWADDPAAKQQWLHGLGWWCQDAERLAAIDAMYRAYCQSMRDRSCLEYAECPPQLAPTAAAAAAAAAPGDPSGGSGGAGGEASGAAGASRQAESGGGGKRGWKGWGANKVQTMRRKMQDRKGKGGGDSADGEPAFVAAAAIVTGSGTAGTAGAAGAAAGASPGKHVSLPPGLAASPSKPPLGAAAAEPPSLESIIDAKWMQSRKIQMPPSIPEAVVRSKHNSRVSSPRAIPRRSLSTSASAEVPSALTMGPASSLGSSALGSLPGDANSLGFATPLMGGSPAVGGGLPSFADTRRLNSSPAHLMSSTAAAASLPPGSPLRGSRRAAANHQERTAAGAGATLGAADSAGEAATSAAGSEEAARQLPEGMPPLISPDYAVNAFITRVGFDLLRRPDFQELLRARIQRQLSRLSRPDYIQSLEVVGVDAGGAAPTLRNLRALPQPEASVWPQLLFDMRYQGAFTVTIELKIDIRDAAAWGKLDQALTRLAQGKKHGKAGASPSHAASSPALGGSGGGVEEDEEEEGEFEQLARSESGNSATSAAGEGATGGGSKGDGKGGSRGMFGGIRQAAARKLRQVAENTAVQIARIPLRLSLTFSVLEGTMVAWIPPPPGNRLFYSFVTPPNLELTARPELAGRLLKYSYHVARVSHWVEQRMRSALTKTMVFPGGGDIPLLPLMALDHPNAADGLPSLGRYMHQQASDAADKARERQQQQEQQQSAAEEEEGHEEERHGAASGEQQQEQQQDAAAGGEHGEQEMDGKREADTQPAAVPATAAPAAAAAAAGGGASVNQEADMRGTQEQADAAQRPPVMAAVVATRTPVTAAAVQRPPVTAAAAPRAPVIAAVAETVSAAAPVEHPQAATAAQAVDAPPARQAHEAQHAQQQDAPVAAAPEAEQQAQQPEQPVLVQQQQQRQGSSSLDELSGEPSLLAGLHAQLSSASEVQAAAAEAGAAAPAAAAASTISQATSHAITARCEATSPPRAAPDFPVLAASISRGGSGHLSAADAWEAAMAVESRSRELPTPRFASQQWQQQPTAAVAAAAPLPGGLVQQELDWGEFHHADPAPQQPRRPSLQLKLSATRSLDPDFTRSAEHTRFGEAPPTALPNYDSTTVRRTLSARSDGSQTSSTAIRGSREAVGAAISRSLASLRRQGSSLTPRHAHEAAEHASQVLEGQEQASSPPAAHRQHHQQQQHQPGSRFSHEESPPQQPQQPQPPNHQQQHVSSPAHQDHPQQPQQGSPGSPAMEGSGSPASGDPPRQRPTGSLKEQAGRLSGKFMNRVNAAGKALASQVHDLQQQRAATRLGRATSSNGSGEQPRSPSSHVRSSSQNEVL